MTADPIRNQSYVYFRTEAQDLLQTIEQGVLNLRENRSKATVHELMRAAHTLKGAAASVELEAIKTVAHLLEDVFKALYDPQVVIDAELENLLFAGYECLRLLLTAELMGRQIDESEILNRAATVIVQLQTKLGDRFGQDAPLPTSADLGFDMVQSMFEIGVSQRLATIQQALTETPAQLEATLRTQAEVFEGLAESLNLPGFADIARTTLAALNCCPDRVLEIAQLALADFSHGRTAVLAGDRSSGGSPSPALQQLALGHTQPPDFMADSHDLPTSPRATQEMVARAAVDTAQPIKAVDATAAMAKPQRSPLMELLLTEIHPQQWLYWCVRQLNATASYLLTWIGQRHSDDSAAGDSITNSTPLPQQGDSHGSLAESTSLAAAPPAAEPELHAPPSEPFPSNEVCSESPADQSLDLSPELSLEQLFGHIELDQPTKQEFKESRESATEKQIGPAQVGSEEPNQSANQFSMSSAPIPTAHDITQSLIQSNSSTGAFTKHSTDSSADSSADSSTAALSSSQQYTNLSSAVPVQPLATGDSGVEFCTSTVDRATGSARSVVGSTPVRVELAQLERLNHLAGELLINQNQQSVETEKLHSMVQRLLLQLQQHQQTLYDLRDWADRFLIEQRQKSSDSIHHHSITTAYATGSSPAMLAEFDALEMDRYGDLHVYVQTVLNQSLELETLAELVAQASQFSRHTLEMQQRLLTHVRDDLTAARMQPLDELLRRFSQVLRQLSSAYQKSVELVLSGTQVLVDKSIVDKLYDPLLHLVRNAFDHGIESPDIRRANGKPETGTIEIKAYHRGNRTVIQVKDDGRGIDLQRIAQRAIELNWVSSEEVHQLTTPQLLSLMFEPGFSTASQLSDLSGRGIGLDVVRSQLQALNGSVSVDFTPQAGTVFSLSIPLSITIAKLLVCQSGALTYAFPVEYVEQVIIPDANQLKIFDRQQRLLHWYKGGEELAIAVRRFSELIQASDTTRLHLSDSQTPETSPSYIVLLNSLSGLIGLQVDQVLGEQELVIRPLGTAIVPPPFVYGCCILTSSQLALAIDVEVLTQKAAQPDPARLQWDAASKALPTPSHPEARLPSPHLHAPHILLVDDSLTLRQTLTLTLQKAGYQVSQAPDGLAALQFLRQQSQVELIICDVEMPRLNGFEFLSQFRRDTQLPNVPVVMLTSRSGSKYRQLALELGATGYLTKPYTDKELLDTVSHLLAANLESALSQS
ncbi:MAG: response regulator [Synechococcales cyanobacterium C42_A2020_086]|jgi:chemotaxis family two-component system sensor histidine kinase/response regulator PixL|nr:response regulator [Synechococcales cyanobacterium C42_A2020_086]